MSILDTFIDKIVPHNCLGCGVEGNLLCLPCRKGLQLAQERCYRCNIVSKGFFTCPACLAVSRLKSVSAAATYQGPAKQLVWKLKLAGGRSAAKIMAVCMASLAGNISADTVIVPVPTATGRQRRRGYDQAVLLSRSLAGQIKVPYRQHLARLGQAHQHGSSYHKRLTQLDGTFRVIDSLAIKGKHILLVDDVVTTGATLEAAARCLHAAGAQKVEAVTFAQTPIQEFLASESSKA